MKLTPEQATRRDEWIAKQQATDSAEIDRVLSDTVALRIINALFATAERK